MQCLEGLRQPSPPLLFQKVLLRPWLFLCFWCSPYQAFSCSLRTFMESWFHFSSPYCVEILLYLSYYYFAIGIPSFYWYLYLTYSTARQSFVICTFCKRTWHPSINEQWLQSEFEICSLLNAIKLFMINCWFDPLIQLFICRYVIQGTVEFCCQFSPFVVCLVFHYFPEIDK